ncbi:MAG: S-methyl thiohydantoin desulfurase domain-containing protein, partial [Candidatus Thorarchaeota archaeon]
MTLILKTRTDVEDLTTGCTFFGTGGGGSKELGLNMLYPHMDAGKTIEIVDVDRVKNDDWVACAYYSGTIAPPT